MKLKGKVALVTGGANRIGRALVLGLVEKGCRVAFTYRTSETQAEALLKEIRRKRGKAIALRVNQKSADQVERAVAEVYTKFKKIDVLINSASSYYRTPLGKVTEVQFNDLIQSNLAGPWWFAQAIGPRMKKQKSGKIINIVDVAAYLPWVDFLPYSAAKGGLVTLTKGLARALAPQVQVNAIAPGPILPPPDISQKESGVALKRTLLKRWGGSQAILEAILYLLEGSDFVTGTVLPVDGGRLLA